MRNDAAGMGLCGMADPCRDRGSRTLCRTLSGAGRFVIGAVADRRERVKHEVADEPTEPQRDATAWSCRVTNREARAATTVSAPNASTLLNWRSISPRLMWSTRWAATTAAAMVDTICSVLTSDEYRPRPAARRVGSVRRQHELRRERRPAAIDLAGMGGRWVSCPYLVGRSSELELLRSTFAETAGGSGPHAVLIGGEAGVGKTRLLAEMVSSVVADGATPLIGACIDVGEGGLPYAPIVEALRAHLGALSPVELERLIGPARADLSHLLPELGRQGQAPITAPTPSGRARLFEHLLGVVSRVASASPLLLVVEDLHWADRSTRDVLFFLLRNLDEQRVLIVGTYRSDELQRRHPLRGFLAEMDRDRRAQRLELAPLSRAELEAQISGILGEPPSRELADSIWEALGGQPVLRRRTTRRRRRQRRASTDVARDPDELPGSGLS